MSGKLIPADESDRQRLATFKQLVISLKFHHGQTLKKIPVEMAIQAILEVWESCNQDHKQNQ